MSLASVGVRAAISCEFQPLYESHGLILEKFMCLISFCVMLGIRDLMNNWIKIFANAKQIKALITLLRCFRVKTLVPFWPSFFTRTPEEGAPEKRVVDPHDC